MALRNDTVALFAHLVPLRSPWPDLWTWKVYSVGNSHFFPLSTLHVGNIQKVKCRGGFTLIFEYFLVILVVVSNNQYKKSQFILPGGSTRTCWEDDFPGHTSGDCFRWKKTPPFSSFTGGDSMVDSPAQAAPRHWNFCCSPEPKWYSMETTEETQGKPAEPAESCFGKGRQAIELGNWGQSRWHLYS